MTTQFTDICHTLRERYKTHLDTINWYISEGFKPQDAADRALDGSSLDNEHQERLRRECNG